MVTFWITFLTGLLFSLRGGLIQGIFWSIMVLGVYITFRLLDIADMTVDGSFALGGCVCVMLVVNKEMNPALAIVIATFAGCVAGAVTGILHTVFEIPAILAGILTQISLWSINLRIMGGKSNIPLLKTRTIFSDLVDVTGLSSTVVYFILGFVICVIMVVLLYWFFGTEIGSALRATGNNEDMIRALGVDTKMTKLLALILSNGLVAMSGALVAQYQKYGDVGMGAGAIVIGLASIVIGEVLFGWLRSFWCKLAAAAAGACVYFMIRAFVLRLGMNANDMKLLSAVIVALALCIPVVLQKWELKRSYSEKGGDESC
ncbi:MAG: ABC transporter permease [bacterium]|nr:ABC transporter permease [bacterium]